MKKSLSALVVLVLCASMLAGCNGGGKDIAALSGKYIIASMDEGGITTDLAEMEGMFTLMGMKLEDAMYLEFKAGGEFDMAIFGESVSGTYETDGNTATLSIDGESIRASIDGDTVTLEQDGTKMVFKK